MSARQCSIAGASLLSASSNFDGARSTLESDYYHRRIVVDVAEKD